MRLAIPISLMVALLLLSAMPSFALLPWQKHGGGPPPAHQNAPPPQQNAPRPNNQPQSYKPQGGNNAHRGEWLRKYMTLPPNQQEQQLQHDPSFKSLPPDRQNHLMDRLRKFNSQPPEKKQQILNRMENFDRMSPQQQQQARTLFDRYRALPDDQRGKVSQGYRRLRGMPPSARNELLNSDEFRNNYTEDERNLLRGMTDLNLAPNK